MGPLGSGRGWTGGTGPVALAHTALSHILDLEDYDQGVENIPEAYGESITHLVHLSHVVQLLTDGALTDLPVNGYHRFYR